MRLATLSLLASSLAMQGAVATFADLWGDNSQPFQCSCAERTPEHCTPSMKSGWKWEGIASGTEVLDAYAGFFVTGLKVSHDCDKSLTEGTSKCAVAAIEKASTGISITRTDVHATKAGFSICSLHLSATVSVQLEFIYTMTDGSTCKHKADVGAGPCVVENQQCGGAVSVHIKVVETVTVKVELTVYRINWECGNGGPPPSISSSKSASKTLPPATPTGYLPTSTVPTIYTPTGALPPPPPPKGTSTATFPGTPISTPTLPIGTPPGSSPTSSTPKTVPGRHPGSGPPTGTSSVPGVFPPGVPTGVFPTAPTGVLPTGPAKNTPPGGKVPDRHPGTGSPPPVGNVPNVCQPTPGICPPVVPKCLATWLFVTKCASNTDADCYCNHFEYTKLVIDCIDARGCSKFEVDIGLSYFVGICAKHIPTNPGIITNLPPKTNLGPPPNKEVPLIPGTPGGGNIYPPKGNVPVKGGPPGETPRPSVLTPTPVISTVPVTVISIVTTFEVPVSTPTGIPTTPGIPTPTAPVIVSKIITVPQVRFKIITVSGDIETGLVPAPPATTPVSIGTALPPFGGPGTISPTGFRPIPTPTVPFASTATPPMFTGAANSNNKASKVVGGVAGGLAALLFL